MKKLISTWKIWQFIEAALLIVIGVTTIVCALQGNVGVIGLVAGIMLIIDGVIHACVNILIKSTDVKISTQAVAVAELALGVWLCIRPEQLAENVVLIASLAIVAAGIMFLGDTVFATIKKSQPLKFLIMQYVITALILAAGIIALVFYPFNGTGAGEVNTITFVLILVGGVLIGLAIYEVAITLILISKAKKAEKEVIDATVAKHEEDRESDKKERNTKQIETIEPEKVEDSKEDKE